MAFLQVGLEAVQQRTKPKPAAQPKAKAAAKKPAREQRRLDRLAQLTKITTALEST